MLRLLTQFAFAIAFIVLLYGCFESKVVTGPTPVPGITDTAKRWINWVGVFEQGTDSATRKAFLENFVTQLYAVRSDSAVTYKDSLDRPLTYFLGTLLRDSMRGAFQLNRATIEYCECSDEFLWQVGADLDWERTDSAGGSTPLPPKPPPGRVSGGVLDAIAQNEPMKNPEERPGLIDTTARVNFERGYEISPAVVAVIDTGIDTLLFDENLRRRMMWHGPSGSQNFLVGGDPNNYKDDHVVKHGSSVATIAMSSFYRESGNKQLPQLMILKAADSLGRGYAYEWACALEYALRNKATSVNSSMGFYGENNDLVNYYLLRAIRDSIPIIAAAGNADGLHEVPLCRTDINNAARLQSPTRMYYPAVLANDMERYAIISVTGFSEPGMPCFYQNYSNEFVTLGVRRNTDEPNCCSFSVPFITQDRNLEGSSFATPVVTGMLTFRIRQGGRRRTVNEYLALLQNIQVAPTGRNGPVTRGNQYIEYP